MAKQSSVIGNLLDATDPGRLQQLMTGTFLTFFVFLGSFLTTVSAISVTTGDNLLANPCIVSCGGYESPDYAQPGPESEQDYNSDGSSAGAYPQDDDNFYNERTPEERDAWDDYFDDGECDECIDTWGDNYDPAMGGGGGNPGRTGGTYGDYGTEEAGLGDPNCLSATGC